MAIGLSNVQTRKAKREPKSPTKESSMTAPLSAAVVKAPRRDRGTIAPEFSGLWMEWSGRVAGHAPSGKFLSLLREFLEIEAMFWDIVQTEIKKRAAKRLAL